MSGSYNSIITSFSVVVGYMISGVDCLMVGWLVAPLLYTVSVILLLYVYPLHSLHSRYYFNHYIQSFVQFIVSDIDTTFTERLREMWYGGLDSLV